MFKFIYTILISLSLLYSEPIIAEPSQTTYSKPIKINTTSDKYKVVSNATYSGFFRVLSVKRYIASEMSDIMPFDMVLSWGKLEENEAFKHLKISQSNRHYYWWMSSDSAEELKINREEVVASSANTHIVPINVPMKQRLEEVKAGSIVYIDGQLIDITEGNRTWKSSLRRNDDGDGSCEIVLVKDFWIVKVDQNQTAPLKHLL